MKKYNKITPEGTKDYTFFECSTYRYIEKNLINMFESYGYTEIMTPALEFLDVFSFDGSAFDAEYLYKTTDANGRIVVLRPDNTIPIARSCATTLKNANYPLRLYYIQKVYQNKEIQRGFKDETAQAGIELIGSSSFTSDLEVLDLSLRSLSLLCNDFCLELGHAHFLKTIMDEIFISSELKEELRLLIRTKSVAELERRVSMLEDTPAVRALAKLPSLFGGYEVLDKAYEFCFNTELKEVVSYLRKLYRALSELHPHREILIDLGKTKSNNYYSGVMFNAYTDGMGKSILSGGRYDSLLKNFGSELSAVGFAFNEDTLLDIVSEKKSVYPQKASILVIALDGFEAKAIEFASNIRSKNHCSVVMSPYNTKDEGMRFALERSFSTVYIVGKEIEEALQVISN